MSITAEEGLGVDMGVLVLEVLGNVSVTQNVAFELGMGVHILKGLF
jgi:hypothetical protein